MGQRTYWMEQPAVDAMCREGREERKEGLNVHAMFKYRVQGLTVNAVFQSPFHSRHTANASEKTVHVMYTTINIPNTVSNTAASLPW